MNFLSMKAKFIAIVLAIVGALGLLKLKERRDIKEGENRNQEKQRKADVKNSDGIRDRVANRKRVRSTDDIEYKD